MSKREAPVRLFRVENDGTILSVLTFGLAVAGYLGLTVVTLVTTRGPVPRRSWGAVAAVIVLHVILLWAHRYGWRFDAAVRHGYGGFLMFHATTLMVVVSVFARERLARGLIHLSFLAISAGAVGATFRFDVVVAYRIPVLLLAAIGVTGLARSYLGRWRNGRREQTRA